MGWKAKTFTTLGFLAVAGVFGYMASNLMRRESDAEWWEGTQKKWYAFCEEEKEKGKWVGWEIEDYDRILERLGIADYRFGDLPDTLIGDRNYAKGLLEIRHIEIGGGIYSRENVRVVYKKPGQVSGGTLIRTIPVSDLEAAFEGN